MREIARGTNRRLFWIAVLTAFVAITLFSRYSFLYPTNSRGDAQCFYTVAKSVAHGKTLYRDIYEQKGPLLYALYLGVEWIPGDAANPFLEIYFLEVAAAAVTLYLLGKTVLLHRGRRAEWLVPLLGALMYGSTAFVAGGSVEEFSLIAIAHALYATHRMLREGRRTLSGAELFVMGLLGGWIFWMKYTSVGFLAGALMIPLWRALKDRNWRGIGNMALLGLLGFAVPSIPVFAYFVGRGALPELWTAYFYNNIFLYTRGTGFGSRLYFFAGRLLYFMRQNPWFFASAIAGWPFFVYKKLYAEAVNIALVALFTALLSLSGGQGHAYYALQYAPLAFTGITALDALFDALKGRRWLRRAVACCAAAACVLIGRSSVDFRAIGRNRADLPAYRYAETIRETPDATLLDLGELDGGLYTAAGILPSNKYFCRLNIPIEEARREWEQMIEEGAVDYIYSGKWVLEGADKYELVQTIGGTHLYRLRGATGQAEGNRS